MTLVEEFLGKGEVFQSDAEGKAIHNILEFFIERLGMTAEDFGQVDMAGIFDDLLGLPLYSALKKIARSVEGYLQKNPEAKETYGAYSNDGEYLPFTIKDIYEIDDETGLFDLPSED